ncbi:unnamed protein product [Paramecium pentaurelia]|uniref:Serine/threonine-protein phosphatase 2A activator n=1 Tax=Paramecium pentaurelia TaxID=43138 RepID=A0A8S1UPL1_9CILI|nr:unnamed protein product [Paramecium pentaurelia]
MDNQYDWSKHQFQQVEKKIITDQDVEKFKKTKILGELLTFLQSLIQSIQHKKISQTADNQKFQHIQQLFQQLEQLLLKVPPIQQSMRYGNKAFRDWLDQIGPIVDDYLKNQLPQNLQNAAVELRSYLLDSFGNKQRIDYGTGHEFQFFLFLFSLFRLGIYTEQDYEGIVRLAFYRYINFARKVQMTYMLEPAGSHGVWGLDDYQFLPFVFGAAELIQNEDGILPDCIIKDNIIKNYKAEYMFFQCIDFINNVKKGPFHEHSPILHSLTNLTGWEKVCSGLLKMFQGEVLFKHPVIKHTYFGTIVEFK